MLTYINHYFPKMIKLSKYSIDEDVINYFVQPTNLGIINLF